MVQRPIDVHPGPFDQEPVELGCILSESFSPGIPGDEIVARSADWLRTTLMRVGIELGLADEEIITAIATDGWSTCQIVGGWVRRARS